MSSLRADISRFPPYVLEFIPARICDLNSHDPVYSPAPPYPPLSPLRPPHRVAHTRSAPSGPRRTRNALKDSAHPPPLRGSLYKAFHAPRGVERFMAPHSKAGQLAQSGGVRVRRSIVQMLLPPHPRQTNPHR